MIYNFDSPPSRYGTDCLKFDFAAERGRPADILPLWVADMDFPSPREVLDAIHRCAEHGIFGYTDPKSDYFEILATWFSPRFGYESRPEWVDITPGVVVALALAVQAYTKPGDAVLIQSPVYYPFREVIVDNDRQIIANSLVLEGGVYQIDFDDFKKKIIQHSIKLFLLCSPHNPTGRVWTREELLRMGELCAKHGVTIVSDEIHCDFAWSHPHTIFPTLSHELAERTVLCTSPAKTFNLAGLQVSNIMIQNEALRAKFKKQVDAMGYSQLNSAGLAATKAAYAYGGEWLTQLRNYLTSNLNFMRNNLRENVPQIRLIEPQGTYLAWLDFRGLGLSESEMADLIINKAGLWLDRGTMFGPEGEGFQRMNFACPRSTLEKALYRLKSAISGL
ncbi:MAG: pyridoxal phosphate-dependent aminotransferase [Oscillospiraceae bacterium]|nr:pyridoxal phosphate-dependent aminotransferase [Oscillospiraceae bacterium]